MGPRGVTGLKMNHPLFLAKINCDVTHQLNFIFIAHSLQGKSFVNFPIVQRFRFKHEKPRCDYL